MTSKDYNLIAAAINASWNVATDEDDLSQSGLALVARQLAYHIKEANPRFNVDKFLDVCYMETETSAELAFDPITLQAVLVKS